MKATFSRRTLQELEQFFTNKKTKQVLKTLTKQTDKILPKKWKI